jgi:hypothetical protein
MIALLKQIFVLYYNSPLARESFSLFVELRRNRAQMNAARCADCGGGRAVQRAYLTKNRLRTDGQPLRAMLQEPEQAPNGIDDEARPGNRPEDANRTAHRMVSGFPTVHAIGELKREQGRHQIVRGIIAR